MRAGCGLADPHARTDQADRQSRRQKPREHCLGPSQTKFKCQILGCEQWKSFRRSRTRFRDGLKLFGFIAEPVFAFILESRSRSPRNAVRNHPGIAFILPGFPKKHGRGFRYGLGSRSEGIIRVHAQTLRRDTRWYRNVGNIARIVVGTEFNFGIHACIRGKGPKKFYSAGISRLGRLHPHALVQQQKGGSSIRLGRYALPLNTTPALSNYDAWKSRPAKARASSPLLVRCIS